MVQVHPRRPILIEENEKSELIDNLRDHKFKDEEITIEEKMLRGEAAGRIEDLEKAILIHVHANPPELEEGQAFEDCEHSTADEQRIAWFMWNSDQIDPEWDRNHNTFTTPWAQ